MSRLADLAIVTYAAQRHGVVDTRDLAQLGVTRHAVARLVAAGQLHRRYRGVYAVGRADLTPDGERRAAVLALGPTALLSHASAAQRWELVGGKLQPLHVTVPGSGRRHQSGLRVHRSSSLHPEDVMHLDGIPLTSPARALLDYAASAGQTRVRHAVEQSEHLNLFDLGGFERVLARNLGAPGAGTLAAVLAGYVTAPDLRSILERDFRDFLIARDLPMPLFNVTVAGHLVDAHWPAWRLVAELDSLSWHLNRRAFQIDRIRDVDLQRTGQRVIRLTSERLRTAPDAVHADILALAALASSRLAA